MNSTTLEWTSVSTSATMLELVKKLARLNDLLERLAVKRERADDTGEEESCHT